METNEKTESEKGKILLEIKKIKLEIKELEKSWFQKPAIWVSAIPAIVAICSFVWVFSSGLLDSKTERLTIQKERLMLDIQHFEAQKDTLNKERQKLISSNRQIANERDSLKAQLAKDIAALKNGNSKQTVYIKLLKEQNTQLQKEQIFYLDEIDLAKSQIISLQKEITAIKDQQASIYNFNMGKVTSENIILRSANKELELRIKKLMSEAKN